MPPSRMAEHPSWKGTRPWTSEENETVGSWRVLAAYSGGIFKVHCPSQISDPTLSRLAPDTAPLLTNRLHRAPLGVLVGNSRNRSSKAGPKALLGRVEWVPGEDKAGKLGTWAERRELDSQ